MSDRPASSSCALNPARRASLAMSNAARLATVPASATATNRSHTSAATGTSAADNRIRSTPAAQPDPRGRPAAELLEQAVVTTAAADARLGAERVGDELEHRSRVVVKTTDERRIELVGDPRVVEQLAHAREVLGVVVGEAVKQQRRRAHRLPRALVARRQTRASG